MRIGRKSSKKEKKAMSISLYCNLFFVIVEWIIAIFKGSQAVLLDAVYDGIEFLMLLPSVFIIPLLYKPSNEKYPFGYMQLESVFIVIKGITMTAVTVGLISNSINIIIHGGKHIDFGFVAWFELIACLISVAVTYLLKRKNKIVHSPLIEAEMNGWKIDSLVSLGMTAGFFIPIILPFHFVQVLAPYLDSIIAIILSIFMIPIPIKTVITGLRDLLLISPEEETIAEIKELTEDIVKKSKCIDAQYDIVKTGRKLWISVYITLSKDELSVRKFKTLQTECIVALSKKFTDFYFELLPEITFDVNDANKVIKIREENTEKSTDI